MSNSDFSSGAGAQRSQGEFRDDRNMDSIMKELFEIAKGEMTDRSIPDVYNRMLNKVRVQMVTRDGNAERLAEVPHIDMLDMAAVFRVVVPGDESTVSTAVTNSLLRRFNVTPEKFRQDALLAAETNNPVRIEGLGNVLSGLENREDDPYDSPLVFAGTRDQMWGAGVMAYPKFMEEAAQKIGGDFFLLPSSVHEVLLLPDDGTIEADYLKELVTTVNMTEVAPEERLTNNAYHYDARERVFDTVDHYREEQEKHSVLKVLDESRKASAKENAVHDSFHSSFRQPPSL